jgi:OOP family OmpA-OmpF porin
MKKSTLLAMGTAFGSLAMAGPVLAANSDNSGQQGLSGAYPSHTNAPTSGPQSFYLAPMALYTHDDPERRTDFGAGGTLRIGKILSEHFNVELALSGSHFFKESNGGNSWDTFSGGLHGLYFFSRNLEVTPTFHLSPFVDVGASFVRSRVHGHSDNISAAGVTPGDKTFYHNDPAFNADLGADFRLNQYGVKLRVEGGYQWTLYGHRPGGGHSSRYVFGEPQVMAGLEIPLGSQQPPPPKEAKAPPQPEPKVITKTKVVTKCPNVPPGVVTDANGCPVQASRILHSVNFALNKSEITANGKDALQIEASRLKAVFKQHPSAHALILGYTDNTGSASYNKKLSQKRADSVRTYLIKQGVSPSKLETRGKGESNPIASNKTRTGRLENRRVQVKVLKAGAQGNGMNNGMSNGMNSGMNNSSGNAANNGMNNTGNGMNNNTGNGMNTTTGSGMNRE